MNKQSIILLYGGRSAEKEVSVLTAESVMRAVDYDRFSVKTYFITQTGEFIKTQEWIKKPSDTDRLMTNDTIDWSAKQDPSAIYEEGAVVFPLLHGPMGEDGSMQGFLEILGLPYVGTTVLSSSVAMDKITTKRVLASAGIQQVPYVVVLEGDDWDMKMDEVEAVLTYPVYTKPSNMGSSVGISKSENREELRQSLEVAFRYDSRLLVEQGVVARELEVGLLGNDKVASTVPGEVVKTVDFYDYEAKYIDNEVQMAIPADVPSNVVETMRQQAELAFRTIGGAGLSRCDFFYTADGSLYLNELNTMPGFTQWSMYPLLWEHMGLSYGDLIARLIQLAQEMYERRERHLG